MLKAVVFDFGNVVGFFDHYKTLAKLSPYTSWPAKRIYEEIYSGTLEDDIESGRMTVEEFAEIFIRRCELTCDAEFLIQAAGDIFTANPAVCELVPRLKRHCRILLGSNTNALHAEQFRREYAEVLGHFHHLVLSYEIGVRKPKAEFFQECAKRAECEPGECLFIDDLPPNVAGAEAIGMRGLLYHPGVDLVAELGRHGIRIGA